MAFYERLPCIAEEKLYVDQEAEYNYIQNNPTDAGWTDDKIEIPSSDSSFVSYWMRLCEENLRERNCIQQEIVNARLPQEANDVWSMKEFTMQERMFEIEEKLMKARKQFQKIAADAEDWASLDYLRWKRDSALEEIRKQNKQRNIPPSYAMSALGKGVKLPSIEKPVARVTGSYKHPETPSLPRVLRSQEKMHVIPGYSAALKERIQEEVHMKETFDLKSASSRLPIRKSGLATEDFLSFWSQKQTNVKGSERSRLPIPVISATKTIPNLGIANENYSSPILKPDFDRNVDLSDSKQTRRGKSLDTSSKRNLMFPHMPSPPTGESKQRTSTNLRRCHYKQFSVAFPQL